MLNIKTSDPITPSSVDTSPSTSPITGYFAYRPAPISREHSYHYSLETPIASPASVSNDFDTVADPTHPLLAYRSPPLEHSIMDVSKVLQLQTAAAYQPSRSNSSDSARSTASATPPAPIRCSRCHQESIFGTARGMINFGTNVYYCKRCADIVGYGG